jgi:hypothetical protein
MNFRWPAVCLLWWLFICPVVMGQSTETLVAVRGLIQRADPRATVEYCGAVSTRKIDYYLFTLERKELAGIVLVEQRPRTDPLIVDADTSFFPFRGDQERFVEKPIQAAIELLLRRRNTAKKRRPPEPGSTEPEVCAIGREIDRVVYPISGFRLGSNSSHEILRLLRTGPTLGVDPRTAPPGSIIVSPTQFSPYGPIYLGHAGIVGSDRSIYSADARYGGARTKNFSLTGWLKQFSGPNGSFAFVIHAPSGQNVQGQ